jgi:hypothetical protein
MARRTLLMTKVPWTGGINSSVDPGVLPDNDLVKADNIVFSSSGSRLKRSNILYIDNERPVPISRSSSGTTRTIKFDGSLITTVPAEQFYVVGEQIVVTSDDGSESAYIGNYTIASITTTTLTNDTITYTAGSSLTESSTAVSASFEVDRRASYIDVRDYWRTDPNFDKLQLLMAFSSQGKLFKYDENGRRTEILPHPEQTMVVTVADVAGSLNSKYFKIYDQNGSVGVYFTNGSGVAPGGVDRTIAVTFTNNDSANTIASLLYTAMDADAQFEAFVDANTVLIDDIAPGARTDSVDVDTGFTITTSIQGRSLSAPFTDDIERACSLIFNERYILAMTGVGNKPIVYRPEDNADYYQPLGGNPPDCSILQEHLSRIWTDDKTDRDRVHYSSTSDHEEWLGNGDSGALDISPGDGDPSGITTLCPPFKGRMFVTKLNRMYQIIGEFPENFLISPITNGLGCVVHKAAAAIDFDDVLFISKKGMHSIAATSAQGAYTGQFLSEKIQPTFNTWPQSIIQQFSSIYAPEINSVAFAIGESDQDEPNALWFYNIKIAEWYRWPSQSPISLGLRLDGNSNRKLIWGTNNSKIVQALNGDFTDFDDTLAIEYRLKTGRIYPDNNPQTIKGFKKLSFLYKPKGRYSFTVKVKIDNLPIQTYGFSQDVIGDELGTEFILGASVLGTAAVFSPFTVPIEGYGRGIEIEIINNNKDDQVELYGYIIEYEPADLSQEVV